MTLRNLAWLALLISCQRSPHDTQACRLVSQGRTSLADTEASAIVALAAAGRVKCSGALLDPGYVLTAAHCFRARGLDTVRTYDARGCSWRNHGVRRVDKHPTLDLAIVTLETPASPAIQPLTIGTTPLHPKSALFAAGVGQSSEELRALSVFEATVEETPRDLVVHYPGGRGLCQGDSGGPLLARVPSGQLTLIGTLRGGSVTCKGDDRFVDARGLGAWFARITAGKTLARSSVAKARTTRESNQ